MILCIENLLAADTLKTIVSSLKTAEFVAGKTTAGWHASLVKHNTQLKGNDAAAQAVRATVIQALQKKCAVSDGSAPQNHSGAHL